MSLGFFFVGGAMAVVIGSATDKLGTRRVRLLCVVVLIGNFPCVFMSNYPSGRSGFWFFFVARIMTGVAIGGSFPLLYSLFGDLAPER